MSERGSAGTSERDHSSEIIFMFFGFTAAIGAHLAQVREIICWRSSLFFWVLLLPLVLILSLRKLWGFLLSSFPEVNSLCLLSLAIIVVHVILSNKILRSYCLNDKI